MNSKVYEEAGKNMLALATGVPIGEVKRAEGFISELLNTHEGLQKVASLLNEGAEISGVPVHDVFRTLTRKIAAGDYEDGLAASTLISEGIDLFQTKQSKGVAGLVPGLLGGAGSTALDLAKTTMLLSAAGGAALGSGYWLLNNKMDEDTPAGQSRVGLEQRLQRYEKAIGAAERKNIKTRAQQVKNAILAAVKQKGPTYAEG